MYKYGQYCPVAKAVEIVGDRWTLLIIRDMLTGTTQFNDLERGLPGISRGLLASRLRRLQQMELVEKQTFEGARRRTSYQLTPAGRELHTVIDALLVWGARWAFELPEEQDLDPLLLMWWMRDRVCVEQLPEEQLVVQFDFTGGRNESYWLLLNRDDVSICMTDPGFGLDLLVTADLSAYFQVWAGRLSFAEVVADGRVVVDGMTAYAKALPSWFSYSLAAPAVRAARAAMTA